MAEVVYALHDFEPENPDEVAFKAGDAIRVLEKDDQYGDGWWQGTNPQGVSGLFPVSFTTYDRGSAFTNISAVESTAAAAAAVAPIPEAPETDSQPPPQAQAQAAPTPSPDPHLPGAFNAPAPAAAVDTAPPSSQPPVLPPVSSDASPLLPRSVPESIPEEQPASSDVMPTAAPADLAAAAQATQTSRTADEAGVSGTMADIDAAISHISGSREANAPSNVPPATHHEPVSAKRQMTASTAESGTDDEAESIYGRMDGAAAARIALAANAQHHRQTAQEQQRLEDQRRTARALQQQDEEEERLARSAYRGHAGIADGPSRLSSTLDGLELSDESDVDVGSDDQDDGFRAINEAVSRPYDLSQPPAQVQPQAAASAYPPPTPPLFSNPVLPSGQVPPQNTAPPTSAPQAKASMPGLGLTSNGSGLTTSPRETVPASGATYEPWTNASRAVPPLPQSNAGAQGFPRPGSSRHTASVRTASVASSVQERDVPEGSFGLGVPTSPVSNPATTPGFAAISSLSRSGTPATTAGSMAPGGDPTDWTVAHVCQWARSKGWDETTVVSKFAEQEISGDVLLDLDINMLKEIDISAFGTRHKIAVAIRDLRRQTAGEAERPGSVATGSHASNPPYTGYAGAQMGYPGPGGYARGSSPANAGRPPSSIHSGERLTPASPSVAQAQALNPSTHPASGPVGYAQPTPVVPSWGAAPFIEHYGHPASMISATQTPPPPAPASYAAEQTTSSVSQRSGAPAMAGQGMQSKPADVLPNPYDWSGPASAPAPSSLPLAQPDAPAAEPAGTSETASALPATAEESAGGAAALAAAGAAVAGAAVTGAAVASGGHKHTRSTELPADLPEWARKEAQAEQQAAASHELSTSGTADAAGASANQPASPPPASLPSTSSFASPPRPSNRRDDRTATTLFGLRGSGRADKTLSRFMSKRLGSGSTQAPGETKPDLKSQISGPTNVLSSNAFASSPSPSAASPFAGAASPTPSAPSTVPRASLQNHVVGGGPPPAAAPNSVMARIRPVDHEGWIKKKGERYHVWHSRYLAVKGSDMVILRDPDATKIKGYIQVKGARVISDETIHPGRYAFKIIHEASSVGKPGKTAAPAAPGEKLVHYFSSDNPAIVRDWMKVLMKSSIARDAAQPVVSSYQARTISLAQAQAMNPPPRPPSPTSLVRTQQATLRPDTAQLTAKDAQILTGFPSN